MSLRGAPVAVRVPGGRRVVMQRHDVQQYTDEEREHYDVEQLVSVAQLLSQLTLVRLHSRCRVARSQRPLINLRQNHSSLHLCIVPVYSHNIPISTKIRLMEALVWPVATYGCESWTLRKNEETRLQCHFVARVFAV